MAALRNRENQRRSRARRKDYIQELEQRLRQYEIAGVKATAEVQGAARKVSEENICLRSLLGIYGVDNGRIEKFVQTGDVSFVSREQWNHGPKMRPTVQLPDQESALMRECAENMRTPPALETDVWTKVVQPPLNTMPATASAVSYDHIPSEIVEGMERTEAPRRSDVSAKTFSLLAPNTPDTPRDQNYRDHIQSAGARDEIACLAAAEIIAGMRGHDNAEEVWSELGCSSSRKCMVKNMAIFQIMDQ